MSKVIKGYKYVKDQRYSVPVVLQIFVVLLFVMHRYIPALVVLSALLGTPLAGAQRNDDKACGQIEILEKRAKAANPSGRFCCAGV
jgi:hypothetical protein